MAEINYLPICLITALRLGLISSISSTSESDSPWWRWLALTSFGSTFIASVSIFHPRYIFGNCPCSMKPYSSEI